jgi:hypothetical protein
MKTQQLSNIDAKIKEFISHVEAGIKAWIKAGKLLVELTEEEPEIYAKIIAQSPQMNAGILGRFEQMGRGMLHPQLLLAHTPGLNKLAAMPYSVQQKYVEEPIPVIVETGAGTDVLLIKAREMTAGQAAQAFASNRLRTEGEQKAWLLDQRQRRAVPVSNTSPWRIKNGKVEFRAGATLTASELCAIISQLTK